MFKCSVSSHLSHEVFFVVGTPGQLSKYKVKINGNPRNLMIGDNNRLDTRAPTRNGNYLFTKVRNIGLMHLSVVLSRFLFLINWRAGRGGGRGGHYCQ